MHRPAISMDVECTPAKQQWFPHLAKQEHDQAEDQPERVAQRGKELVPAQDHHRSDCPDRRHAVAGRPVGLLRRHCLQCAE